MRRKKHILRTGLVVAGLFYCYSLPVFAITEAEVQAQVATVGREAVTGNVFIWFLCAVAFLKVSQKIDSFLSSLGINVGHTGGSMLAEAMMAAKGLGTMMSFSNVHGGKGSTSYHSGQNKNSFSGGLAGIANRQITNNAIKSATTPTRSNANNDTVPTPKGLGERIYSSSVSKGGSFANNVISTIAIGNIREQGSITGEKATEAIMSYLGFNALEEGATNIPSFSNVEIGGGHITGVETSESHPEGISFGMYHADQYAAPQGNYETVHSIDGNTWYKQYAADTVEKTPYNAPDGTVAYNESIVKKLPPPPIRKDRI